MSHLDGSMDGDWLPKRCGSRLRVIGLGDSLDDGVCCRLGAFRTALGVDMADDTSAGDLGMRDPVSKRVWPPRGVSMLPHGDGSPPGLGCIDMDAPEGARSRLLVDETAELLCADGASDPGVGRALRYGDGLGSGEGAVAPLSAAARFWLGEGMASGATGCVTGCVDERAGTWVPGRVGRLVAGLGGGWTEAGSASS